jgi:hypothetical protein
MARARWSSMMVLFAISVPVWAQIDIAGDWASRTHEDQGPRIPGAELGDYTGLPINAAARQKAAHWDASILSLPEQMAKPHPAQYFMRGPGPNIRVNKVIDPVTQNLIAFTIEGMFGRDDRVIWMDGRPHPSDTAEHTWDGFSTGEIKGNHLIITTTHMKYGVLQRNGVPASPVSTMTEDLIRHGDILTDVIVVDDPVYLEEPLVRTSQWVRTAYLTPDVRFSFEVVDEIANRPKGYVPHVAFGTKPDAFAKAHGLPFEATQGGKESTYPEYEVKLEQMLSEMAKNRAK